MPEASLFLTVVTMVHYVPAWLRRAETARWTVFLSWGSPQHPPPRPGSVRDKQGAAQAKAQETRLAGVRGSGPWRWCGSRTDGALASPVATWAPSAGKVSASSLGVTSTASVPLSYRKAGGGGGSPALRHREE